ncbi:NUDIX hydrolase [Streptomyces prasinopilosus]|uniref:ADP-ribose pyrophosphatase YjhB, NUDIX family n=1 Tax=Streptomyces prasinopilosus TaxID=67344 RepID=A0A1G6IR11_9ACTN|nr:NUDIX hydrolase [Streptomyces prasinopilosus]SDC08871.1 ADP-ribose pyrophosphatase YjhB, NUDIX family [Streptomyces prasinopilosus]
MRRTLRVAAYAVVVRDGRVLLARSPAPAGAPEWVLPGGGTEHGEDPYDTVRREVEEETGYRIEVTGLLGVDSVRHPFVRPLLTRRAPTRHGFARRPVRRADHHAVRLVYEGRITGGELRNETGGSTDLAAWQPLDAVPDLVRIGMVDTGLRLWRERPATGRVERAEG